MKWYCCYYQHSVLAVQAAHLPNSTELDFETALPATQAHSQNDQLGQIGMTILLVFDLSLVLPGCKDE